ncbi:SAM-dependent methyltransferase [Luteimonas yindakuii]|uniref:SAM-dependent methyltransferase n=1 Tax=Luteimonas yindakuii TaxID=2565782 RepID=UPI001AA064CC|nr:SAM-dependent methyltransferase [Luteimonas yindakuii]
MGGRGRLSCVGLGMMLGAHLAPRARSEIASADVVFVAAADPIVERWVQGMHADVRSLQSCYGDGRSRHAAYRDMVSMLLAEVRRGARVCGAFYGHPGVFATVPHRVIAQAREEGFDAWMEPAVSAEDCLYADLGIDPGRVGCLHLEASQYLAYVRTVDPTAYLVLWQIGVVGDLSVSRRSTGAAERALLVEKLLGDRYPPDHEVILYEAATLPVDRARVLRITLAGLVDAAPSMQATLVIPPAGPILRDDAMIARLRHSGRQPMAYASVGCGTGADAARREAAPA